MGNGPYLLDTATVSEYRKTQPNPGVIAWAEANVFEESFLGTPTLGELIQGVYKLAPSPQREKLRRWVTEIENRFDGHIASFDVQAARMWGEANGKAQRRGRKLSPVDSQLAAIALVNNLTVVTRNVRNFEIPEFQERGLRVISPWS